MNDSLQTLIGGAWLAARFQLDLVQPLTAVSRIGGRRASRVEGGLSTETYVPTMRPAPNLRGHLTFHLKHELPHLELLSRLFAGSAGTGAVNGLADELVNWIVSEPNGQYARRAGFFYEWLAGRELPIQPRPNGAYVEAVDPNKVVAASPEFAVPTPRWRVRNNLPGTPAFCPIVRKTPQLLRDMALDIPALLAELQAEFGNALLMKSAAWLTLRESKASFAIEGEAGQADRIQRFADVLARRTGQAPDPLHEQALAELQAAILGPRTSIQMFGIRQSPVFVGEVARFEEVVHYAAPPPQDVAPMLAGLSTFLLRTQGQPAVMRAAVAAFGFVYIHPLADGNGRVHRFLINDVLRRDGAAPAPVILPVSALISADAAQRQAYDHILDEFSRPLMRRVAEHCEFAATRTAYPDGVTSNIVFSGAEIARHAWRTPDLTVHVSYLSQLIARTIQLDMRDESRFLRNHGRARAAVKNIIEMPDAQADRVIRSLQANPGALSKVLAKEVPALAQAGVWDALAQAVQDAFRD